MRSLLWLALDQPKELEGAREEVMKLSELCKELERIQETISVTGQIMDLSPNQKDPEVFLPGFMPITAVQIDIGVRNLPIPFVSIETL